MAVTTWALPVGILGGICGLMFVFFWWWFPRHWKQGVTADMREVDEARRARELAAQNGEGGVELGDGSTGTNNTKSTTFKYTPPAYAS